MKKKVGDHALGILFPGANKILLKMKLTLCIILFSFLGAIASESYSQTTKLSLDLKNTTVKEVLGAIENQSEFFFLYSEKIVDVNRNVNIEVHQSTIEKILDQIFAGTNVNYTVKGRQIVLTTPEASNFFGDSSAQQQKSVSGKVTDSSGAPLPGVSVVVKGTTTGVITDMDGKYSLVNVPEKATLQFSFVGMKTQEIVVGNKTSINVTLTEETVGIEEVVAVGYGTQKKVSLTAAISNMKTQELVNIPTSNLSTALASKASGVFIRTGSGVPGKGSIVRIRASSSWNGGTPLFVIDGVVRDQVSFDAMDPSQIENIAILKDAASAAIYGSRASDGVMLITTKVGKMGKPIVQINSVFGVYSHPEIDDNYLDMNTGMDIYNSLYPGKINDYDRAWVNKNNPDGRLWYNEAYQAPSNQKHNVNISGGDEHLTYMVGGSFYNEDGFLPQVGYKKYNLRVNIQAKVTKDLTFSLNLNTSKGTKYRFAEGLPGAGGDNLDVGGYYGILRYQGGGFSPPYMDGKAVSPGWLGGNAIDVMRNGGYWRKSDQLMDGLVSLEYKMPWVKGLTLKASYSSNTDNTFVKSFGKKLPEYHFKSDPLSSIGKIITNEVVSTGVSGSPNQEYIGNENGKLGSYQLNGMITYDTRIGKHHLNAVAVYEQFESDNAFSQLYKYNFPYYTSDQFLYASPSSANTKGSGYETQNSRLSYIGRINYEYADKYLISASVREDGSIKFAPSRRWGLFPSASLGWIISNESFFQQSKMASSIDMMKLRFSYGATGNDAIGGWLWQDLYNASRSSFYLGQSGSQSSILEYGGIPNYDLTWETSEAYNLGLDMTLFKKLNLTIEAWKKHSYNILGERILALPIEFGAKFPATNYGIVDAQGLEIELGYTDGKIGNDFTYSVKANFGLATTNVVRKDYQANALPAENPNGKPLNYLIGYNATGIIRTQQDLSKLPTGYKIFGAAPELGMMNFEDVSSLNGKPDGIIDAYDQMVISKYTLNNAPISYGLSLNFKYKRFSLDALLGGLAGHKISYSDPWNRSHSDLIMCSAYFDDAWSETNPNGKAPKIFKSGDPRANGYVVPSTYNIYSGNFLRLKNVSLTYNLPSELLKKVGIGSTQIFVGGTNLFCLRKFKLFDPESYGFATYPANTSITMGFNIQF